MTLRDRVLDKLASSPFGRQILEEEAADTLAIRKAKVVLLAALTTDRLKALPASQAAIQTAVEAVKACQDALRAAQAEYGRRSGQERAAGLTYDRERAQLEADLIATADPAISAFVGEMHAAYEKTRQIPISNVGGTADGRGGYSPVTSNAGDVQARLKAITNAREVAEALKLEALDGAEVVKRLRKLWATIPEVR